MRSFGPISQFLDNGAFEKIEFIDGGRNGFSSDPTDILLIRGRGAKNSMTASGSELDAAYLEKINIVYKNLLDRVRKSLLEQKVVQEPETSEQKNNRLLVVKNTFDDNILR